jgi:hypothetical protein
MLIKYFRARIAQNNEKNRKNMNFLSNSSKDDYSNDSTPTLVITTDQVFNNIEILFI